MNLSDVKNEGVELEESLKKFKCDIDKLELNIVSSHTLHDMCFNIIFNKKIDNQTTQTVQNAKTLQAEVDSHYNKFLQALRDIDFTDSIIELTQMDKEYNYFEFNDFKNNYLDMIKTIHKFTANNDANKRSDLYIETVESIRKAIKKYEDILNSINEIKNISRILIGEYNASDLKIRFMNENNTISNLLDNITIIKRLYNTMNKLVGNEEIELTYTRIESGTLEINLTGCVTTLAALLPTLTFIYKIYSENFSWKAKQEKQLGEIKVRKDILSLIKEVKELKSEDINLLQQYLFDLELEGRKLFINNPCIKLNDEEIGIKEAKTEYISKEFLQSKIPQLEEKEAAIDENVNLSK